MQDEPRQRRTADAPSADALVDYLLEHVSDAVAVIDPSVDPPLIVASSAAHEALFHAPTVGRPLGQYGPSGLLPALRRVIDDVLASGPRATGGTWQEPTGRRNVHAVWRVVEDGDRRFVAGHAVDADVAQRAADTVPALEVLLDATLAERRRHAQHLHDDAVQVLAAVALELAWLERRAGEHAEAVHRLRSAIEALNGRFRALITNLDPAGPAAADLGTALAEGLRPEAEAAGVALRVEDQFGAPLPGPLAEALYWIATEAVHNAIAHAGASTIHITISLSGSGVALTVRDDGRGFDPLQVGPGPRYGLISIRTRAHRLGGMAGPSSRIGEGTTVHAWLPLDGEGPTGVDRAGADVADAIREFDADLRFLWNVSECAVVVGDGTGVITRTNPAAVALLPTEPLGRPLGQVWPTEELVLAGVEAVRTGATTDDVGALRSDPQRRFRVERIDRHGGPPWAWLLTIAPSLDGPTVP